MSKTLLFIFLLLISCQTPVSNKKSVGILVDSIEVDSNNIPIDKDQGYFPYEMFRDTNVYVGSDTFLVDWYSSHLRAMNEPLVVNSKVEKEVYRFLWLRTFDHPISIRIEKLNQNITLTWKLCDGAGGYEPGDLIINKTTDIDEENWKKFNSLLRKADYWNQKTSINDMGNDGSQWILEGKKRAQYHVVDRWSPSGGRYFDCCYYLIELTDLKIEDQY